MWSRVLDRNSKYFMTAPSPTNLELVVLSIDFIQSSFDVAPTRRDFIGQGVLLFRIRQIVPDEVGMPKHPWESV